MWVLADAIRTGEAVHRPLQVLGLLEGYDDGQAGADPTGVGTAGRANTDHVEVGKAGLRHCLRGTLWLIADEDVDSVVGLDVPAHTDELTGRDLYGDHPGGDRQERLLRRLHAADVADDVVVDNRRARMDRDRSELADDKVLGSERIGRRLVR